MKILIVVKSFHKENTLKIAEAMSEAAPVTIARLEDIQSFNLKNYDIVGFGSGVYAGKPDKDLIKFINEMDYVGSTFTFATSLSPDFDKANNYLSSLLENKGCYVLGSFGCKGYAKLLFLSFNKTKPDIDDFDNAQKFITEIVQKYNETKLN